MFVGSVNLLRGSFVGHSVSGSVSGSSLGWSVGNDNNSVAKKRYHHTKLSQPGAHGLGTLVKKHAHTHMLMYLLHGVESFLRS